MQVEQVASGSATEITANTPIGMYFTLRAPYRGQASWL